MRRLTQHIINEGYLQTPEIIEAFNAIDRKDFIQPELANEAYFNSPLPIGHGQTISQPLTVAFMLERLQPQAGDNILDVGYGSGWQTALLAHLVGPRGKVVAIERIKELKDFGEKNVAKYGFRNVKFILGDGSLGYSSAAPFDKIIVAAAAAKVPPKLLPQLKIKGRLVIPVGEGMQDIVVITKVGGKQYIEQRFAGFIFVPLIEGK